MTSIKIEDRHFFKLGAADYTIGRDRLQEETCSIPLGLSTTEYEAGQGRGPLARH